MANLGKRWTQRVAIGHLLVTFVPLFQNESSSKTFHMKMNLNGWTFRWKIFSNEWFRSKTRFDTEAKGNPEVGNWVQVRTWTLWMASSPTSSLACSRWGSLERISCITRECDRTSCLVIGRRLCAINWCTNRLTVDSYKKWKKERKSFSDKHYHKPVNPITKGKKIWPQECRNQIYMSLDIPD